MRGAQRVRRGVRMLPVRPCCRRCCIWRTSLLLLPLLLPITRRKHHVKAPFTPQLCCTLASLPLYPNRVVTQETLGRAPVSPRWTHPCRWGGTLAGNTSEWQYC